MGLLVCFVPVRDPSLSLQGWREKTGEGKEPSLSLSLSLYPPLFSLWPLVCSTSGWLSLLQHRALRLLQPPTSLAYSSVVWVVEMMTRVKRAAPMDRSPSSSSYPVGGDEARATWKHQSLMQDYEELFKETEAKKMKLQQTIQKKLKLLAEVKFLKKKYRTLSENPTQETRCRLKKQSRRILPPVINTIQPPPKPVTQREFPLKDGRNHIPKEVAAPSMSRLLDLNQVSLSSGDEMQVFQECKPLEVKKSSRGTVDEEATANDLKQSICRDAGNSSNRVGKRKISWQDPVALRV